MQHARPYLRVFIGACLILLLLGGMVLSPDPIQASGGGSGIPIPGDTTGNDDSIDDPIDDGDDTVIQMIVFFGTIL